MTELTIPDNIDIDYVLCGYRGTKPERSCIVYASYIPM